MNQVFFLFKVITTSEFKLNFLFLKLKFINDQLKFNQIEMEQQIEISKTKMKEYEADITILTQYKKKYVSCHHFFL